MDAAVPRTAWKRLEDFLQRAFNSQFSGNYHDYTYDGAQQNGSLRILGKTFNYAGPSSESGREGCARRALEGNILNDLLKNASLPQSRATQLRQLVATYANTNTLPPIGELFPEVAAAMANSPPQEWANHPGGFGNATPVWTGPPARFQLAPPPLLAVERLQFFVLEIYGEGSQIFDKIEYFQPRANMPWNLLLLERDYPGKYLYAGVQDNKEAAARSALSQGALSHILNQHRPPTAQLHQAGMDIIPTWSDISTMPPLPPPLPPGTQMMDGSRTPGYPPPQSPYHAPPQSPYHAAQSPYHAPSAAMPVPQSPYHAYGGAPPGPPAWSSHGASSDSRRGRSSSRRRSTSPRERHRSKSRRRRGSSSDSDRDRHRSSSRRRRSPEPSRDRDRDRDSGWANRSRSSRPERRDDDRNGWPASNGRSDRNGVKKPSDYRASERQKEADDAWGAAPSNVGSAWGPPTTQPNDAWGSPPKQAQAQSSAWGAPDPPKTSTAAPSDPWGSPPRPAQNGGPSKTASWDSPDRAPAAPAVSTWESPPARERERGRQPREATNGTARDGARPSHLPPKPRTDGLPPRPSGVLNASQTSERVPQVDINRDLSPYLDYLLDELQKDDPKSTPEVEDGEEAERPVKESSKALLSKLDSSNREKMQTLLQACRTSVAMQRMKTAVKLDAIGPRDLVVVPKVWLEEAAGVLQQAYNLEP